MVKKKGSDSKKKSGKKDAKSQGLQGPAPEEDPARLLTYYTAHCSAIGININSGTDPIVKALSNLENPNLGKQILIDGNSDRENHPTHFSSGHCRAFALACLGRPVPQQSKEVLNNRGEPVVIYRILKEIRIWRLPIGNNGIEAISDILRLGNDKISLSYLEFLDCEIGDQGAKALGKSLSCGMNRSLRTLNLDSNVTLSCSGAVNLCFGLKSNVHLVNLSLKRCNIGSIGASALGEVLNFPRSNLELLDLTGNRIGGHGLLALCDSMKNNKRLSSLFLADNAIMSTNIDAASLRALCEVGSQQWSNLVSLDLRYNQIGKNARELLPGLGLDNKRLSTFLVDVSLPRELFMVLNRSSTGGKSKAKKKGKKKQKKK